jgi:acetyl esterase
MQIRAKRAAVRAALKAAEFVKPAPIEGDHGVDMDPRVAVLWKVADIANTPVHRLTARAARRDTREGILAIDPGRPAGVTVSKLTVAGEPGTGLRDARLYTPDGLPDGSALLVWFHQGGYVVGGLDESDTWCANVAKHARIRVLNVNYRHAPEHTFPAFHEDGYAAYHWALQHAGSIGADPSRVAVGGASAGANLTAGLGVRLRDAGEPLPVWQLMLYPLVDCLERGGSMQTQAECYPLDLARVDWFHDTATPNIDDRSDLRISPMRAESLAGLAPSLVVTAGFDPLRDQGRAFVERIVADGGEAEHRCFETLPHSFHVMAGVVPAAERANAWVIGQIAKAIGG